MQSIATKNRPIVRVAEQVTWRWYFG